MVTAARNVNQSLAVGRRSAQQFVSSFLREIPPEACFCARTLLAEHPEVAAAKSAVLDLALEECCRREAAGEIVDRAQFARQFDRHAASVLHLLELHAYYEAHGGQLASALIPWPKAGEEFLGFLLLDELGRGACARVFLATQVAIGERLVVLKVSPNHAAEVNALGRLSHPHIVPIHSVQCDERQTLSAICMPFLGRATLDDVLIQVQTGDRMPALSADVLTTVDALNAENSAAPAAQDAVPRHYVELVISIAGQIASALEYTHRQGFCHYDIKPTNVLLGQDGVVRLIDFNLAAMISREKSGGGTVPYMSPEQLRRHLHQDQDQGEGPPSDLFSLGVMLFELLTGRHPFRPFRPQEDRWQAAAELLKCQQTKALSIRRLNPQVDRQLESIVLACLSFDPQQRPDAKTLRAELQRAASPPKRLTRWSIRHRRSLCWTVAAVLALTVGYGWHAATSDSPATRCYKQAVAFEQAGNLDAAVAACTAGLVADDTRADLWYERGQCRLALKEVEKAYEDFHEALKISKNSNAPSAAYAGYCLCLLKRDWPTAIELLELAESLGVHEAGLLNDLAFCHYKLRHDEQAQAYVNECLQQDPSAATAHFILARLLLRESSQSLDRGHANLARTTLDQSRNELLEAKRLGFETADAYLDLVEADIRIATRLEEPLNILRINQFLQFAYGLHRNLETRTQELVKVFPQLNGELAPPLQNLQTPGQTASDDQRLPVIDPFQPIGSHSAVASRD